MGVVAMESSSQQVEGLWGRREKESLLFGQSRTSKMLMKALLIFAGCIVLFGSYFVLFNRVVALTQANTAGSAILSDTRKGDCSRSTTTVPQYFQTSPELWAGPTATGRAPFLAQTNPVFFAPTATFVPNYPLETAEPIAGQGSNQSIFQLMGHLSSYFPNPEGFGVAEYPLPAGAKIAQVQMLSRHGSRYPTSGTSLEGFAKRIAAKRGTYTASGPLSFLNDWTYALGAEILVPKGRQELFDSGILHYYQYGQLYNPNSKIIARTTTQDRMLKSAEYFMAGFFGLEWTNNATLEVIIESEGFNNSLAGYDNCPNSNNHRNSAGQKASSQWVHIYLQDARERFKTFIKDFDWTIEDTYAAQTLCPYETVAFGYSAFCSLFTYQEWEYFEYAQDIVFAGSSSFQSPVARAVGIGYVQETVARLKNHTLGYSGSQINVTLDSSTDTFPLNQTLYFDFSHDTNIMAILTAFGFTQFSQFLPATEFPGPHNLTVSHLEPFAARLDIEIIKTPHPVLPDSKERAYDLSASGRKQAGGGGSGETTYVHFILNQRTVPLGVSFKECGERIDGWCELQTFLKVMESKTEEAQYEEACFGDWDAGKYGDIMDGRPPAK